MHCSNGGESEINKLWRSTTPPASCVWTSMYIVHIALCIYRPLLVYNTHRDRRTHSFATTSNIYFFLLETSSRDVMLSKFKALSVCVLLYSDCVCTCAFSTGGNNFMNVKFSIWMYWCDCIYIYRHGYIIVVDVDIIGRWSRQMPTNRITKKKKHRHVYALKVCQYIEYDIYVVYTDIRITRWLLYYSPYTTLCVYL